MTTRRWNSTIPIRKARPRAQRVTVVSGGRQFGKTATGQLWLFEQLYRAQGGLCAISGEPLVPPGGYLFHCQGSHLLPKGSYRRGLLWPTNTIMILKRFHDLWGNTGNKWDLVNGNDKLQPDERWRPYVERYFHLQTLYNTSDYNGEELTGRWAMDSDEGRETERSRTVSGGNQGPRDPDHDLPF